MEKIASDSIAKEAEREDFVINILPDLPHANWQEYCIYRVPKQLRKVNEEAYTPKLVSIGPFHHGEDSLKDMEMHKLEYLENFLQRTKKNRADLLKIIEDNEVKIRHCYSEYCGLVSVDFVKMILLDAVFIIELFSRTHYEKEKEKEKDYILSKPWLRFGILHDLILLENQLPFFVLEELYMFAFNEYSSSCNFVELSRSFFSWYDQSMKKHDSIGKEVRHLTDFVRYLFCSVPDLILKPREYTGDLYSATKLDYAGLKFKPYPFGERSLLDIRLPFKLSWLQACLPCLKLPFPCLERVQSILKIPQLVIDDNTEVVFRNLMALEQCHYPSDTYICSYVLLMNSLINTEQDVGLLVEKNVIVNCIGSNVAVTRLFDKLCIQIWVSDSCYGLLTKEINDYCDNCWNRIMASIKRTYFRDFGRCIATVGVLLALLGLFIPFLTKYI